jgi:threonine dehydratase
MSGLTMADILAAHGRLQPHVWSTPLVPSPALSQHAGGTVFLKLECWQRTGSIKVRGALNRVASLLPGERLRGVVTASAGNHGLAVALAAEIFGLPPAVVFLPENAAENKVRRLTAAGCDLHRAGVDYDAAHSHAQSYAKEQGALYLSAYDDPAVIAGQATVGLEILLSLPEADVLLIPIGGGGLMAGVAVVARALRPAIRIIGLQPETSPAAYLSFRDGRPYETHPAGPTICDGLAGGFGRLPFELARGLIDDILLVPEPAIRRAVAFLITHEQLLVEGSGAITVACLLSGQLRVPGSRVVAILTGRNLDADLARSCLDEFGRP